MFIINFCFIDRLSTEQFPSKLTFLNILENPVLTSEDFKKELLLKVCFVTITLLIIYFYFPNYLTFMGLVHLFIRFFCLVLIEVELPPATWRMKTCCF